MDKFSAVPFETVAREEGKRIIAGLRQEIRASTL
jgi:hypothetical protein